MNHEIRKTFLPIPFSQNRKNSIQKVRRQTSKDVRVIRFIKILFSWLGSQNDYLYPFKGQINLEGCPYPRPHWWKTRVGFRTAWGMAKLVDKILQE